MLRLSIIVPIYNVEPYIEKCLLSLEKQDIPGNEYEIICINDGSPDNSREVVVELQKEFENIILIDLHEISIIADYFVICSGTSSRMLQALIDSALDELKKEYDLRGRVEGLPEDGWLLADFGEVILHIFSPDRREFYRLEDLWSEGKILLHLR